MYQESFSNIAIFNDFLFLNVSDIVKYKLILIKITVINNNQLQKLHVLFFRFLSTGGSYRSSTFSYNSTILLTVRDIWKATLELLYLHICQFRIRIDECCPQILQTVDIPKLYWMH